MTERSPDEELDNARAALAARLWAEQHGVQDAPALPIAALAAKLAREGWEPEDPLWIEAWRLCDEIYHERSTMFSECRSKNDRSPRLVYAGLKRGMELAKERG